MAPPFSIMSHVVSLSFESELGVTKKRVHLVFGENKKIELSILSFAFCHMYQSPITRVETRSFSTALDTSRCRRTHRGICHVMTLITLTLSLSVDKTFAPSEHRFVVDGTLVLSLVFLRAAKVCSATPSAPRPRIKHCCYSVMWCKLSAAKLCSALPQCFFSTMKALP